MANFVTALLVLTFVAAIAGRHAAVTSTDKVIAASNVDVTTFENATRISDDGLNITDEPDAGSSDGGAWVSVQAFFRLHWVAMLGTVGFIAALCLCCRCCCCKHGALFTINMPYSRVNNHRL